MAKKKREMKRSFVDHKREMKRSFVDHLPEPIIQHILSFLPEKDAAKTSILSKAWLTSWRTKPNLEFNSELFLENFGKEEEEEEERCEKFSKYVNRTLKRYTQQKISIETLKLDANIDGEYSPVDANIDGEYSPADANIDGEYSPVDPVDSLVQRCTRVAVERGVKNLCLSACCELPQIIAQAKSLPQIIAGAKSLVDLSLSRFNMLHLSAEKIMWHSLKRLCLEGVYFDESMFENIISSCPLLEILEISYAEDDNDIDQPQYFKVMEHHNLKRLTFRLYMSQNLILAEVPKLESLICTYEDADDWTLCGLSLHSSQYQNLKMLDLWGVAIADDFFNNFEQKFPVLKELFVRSCKDLRRIKISSQTLERIQLAENNKLEEAHFDVPSIERLDYICFDCKIMPEFSFSTATKHHWISKLRIGWRGNVDSCWFLTEEILG